MQEIYDQLVTITERNYATSLGNLERMEKWARTKFFPASRKEWFHAWNLVAKRHRFAPALQLRAGRQKTLSDVKTAAIAILRNNPDPGETLKRHADTIMAAAREGDVAFFHQIGLALTSRARRKPDATSLSWDMLPHWFAGLLWLMNAETGIQALRAYTGRRYSVENYRRTARRLGLKDYPGNTRSPPIIAYHPKTRRYVCSASWTHMEQ